MRVAFVVVTGEATGSTIGTATSPAVAITGAFVGVIDEENDFLLFPKLER